MIQYSCMIIIRSTTNLVNWKSNLGVLSLCVQVIFDFRFLALLAIGGSLAGSLLCFLNVISHPAVASTSL